MTLEPGPLAQLAAEFIDELEDEYGEDAEIRRFGLVAEVVHDHQGDLVANTVHIRTPHGYDTTECAGLYLRGCNAALNPDL